MHRAAVLLLISFAFAGAASAESKRAPTLTIDVKNAEVREIFSQVKRQCRIRNLIIDRDVKGTGTFLFRAVPCPLAIRVITASLGLDYEIEPSYVRVAPLR